MAITLNEIREFLKNLPEVEEGISWDSVSFKINKKLLLLWNSKFDAPVFRVSAEEREFLFEFEGETFFDTDHHRKFGVILGRPEKVDKEWVFEYLRREWRRLAPKRLLKDLKLLE